MRIFEQLDPTPGRISILIACVLTIVFGLSIWMAYSDQNNLSKMRIDPELTKLRHECVERGFAHWEQTKNWPEVIFVWNENLKTKKK